MSAALAHVAALMLIKSIAEGNDTAATLPRIAKIAAAALGSQAPADIGAQGGARRRLRPMHHECRHHIPIRQRG